MPVRTPPPLPDPALDEEPPSGSTAPRSSGTGERAKRNGHATVIGRFVELALALPPGDDLPRTAALTFADEALLRDADERQLGRDGVAIASSGSAADWRAFLGEHFRRRYDMTVVFDAPRTRIG